MPAIAIIAYPYFRFAEGATSSAPLVASGIGEVDGTVVFSVGYGAGGAGAMCVSAGGGAMGVSVARGGGAA